MSGFGENLRREREMRGITLREIADSTKISVRFLEAVETEQFSKLPGGIFARSFIRSYAGYLGLDEERVMAEYHVAAPHQGEEDFSRIGVTGSTANHRPRAPVLPWIIAVILLAGGYGIFRYAHRTSEEPLTFGNPPSAAADPSSAAGSAAPGAQAPAPSQATANPASRDAQSGTPPILAASSADGRFPDATSNSALYPAAQQGAGVRNIKPVAATGGIIAGAAASAVSNTISLAKAEAQGEMVLQVAATQPAWIAVDADGKTVLEHVLTPHEVQTLVAKDYFDVTTGNAQGTVLTLDGVTLKSLGQYGEVKKVHLTRDDLKNHTP